MLFSDFDAMVAAALTERERVCDWHPEGTKINKPLVEDPTPYPYQRRLAEEGQPELLRAPTGSGKTLAATLPWLYRRRFHSDDVVCRQTPHRLVIVLPQRSLVEQTHQTVACWLKNLGLSDHVGLHLLMGGASTDDQSRLGPSADAVFVGTQDMIMSRLLMRGYAESYPLRPMSFGLLHASTQFVFDEVQLMGPALPTSLQLEGLRREIGTAIGSRSMWMSATAHPGRLRTIDYSGPSTTVELTHDDRCYERLRVRLNATRTVRRLETPDDPKRYGRSLAEALVTRHGLRTRTIAVLNTVARASEVFDAVLKTGTDAAVVLLHSRFRPSDRRRQIKEALGDVGATGTIVISTQVLEAGVDTSSRLMLTEAAPWSSVVQRAGRCNRAGEATEATLLWTEPPSGRNSAAPYQPSDVEASVAALTTLEGTAVTGTDLHERDVSEHVQQYSVLRRRDLFDLFDTAPDLSGNDIDVTRWIRDADAVTVGVAWRTVPVSGPAPADRRPGRDELCQAPVGEVRDLISEPARRAWVIDPAEGSWRPAAGQDARPGGVVIFDAAQGGYQPDRGWSPRSKTPVAPVVPEVSERPDGLGNDQDTCSSRWVALTDHLADVDREVSGLLDEYGETPGLTDDQRKAARLAGRYHDLGKAHRVFAASLAAAAARNDPPTRPSGPGPWAKSDNDNRLVHDPPYFRHELISALMLLSPKCDLLDGVAEADLITYLVAAHHGKARLTIRSAPAEEGGRILGVERADESLPLSLPDGRELPALPLDRDVLALGATTGGESWQAMACRLRDRLGPFRLAFLEAVVRCADWMASASYKVSEE